MVEGGGRRLAAGTRGIGRRAPARTRPHPSPPPPLQRQVHAVHAHVPDQDRRRRDESGDGVLPRQTDRVRLQGENRETGLQLSRRVGAGHARARVGRRGARQVSQKPAAVRDWRGWGWRCARHALPVARVSRDEEVACEPISALDGRRARGERAAALSPPPPPPARPVCGCSGHPASAARRPPPPPPHCVACLR